MLRDSGVVPAPRRTQRKIEPRVMRVMEPNVLPPTLPISLTQMKREMAKLPSNMRNFLKSLKTINFTGQNVMVSHYSKIFSMDWHPDSTQLLLATGDTNGNIGTRFGVVFHYFLSFFLTILYILKRYIEC